ncbi:MAG: MoaD/ThiS family protein [Streptosporangiaceae bacterium]|jgi:molybdopterin converting factor small subunit
MALVTFRYWAAAKEAAGVGEETIRAETLAEALAAASGERPARAAGLNPRLRDVLARSSFLIDGVPVGIRPPEAVTLSDASVIEVLPPFAGG